MCNSVEAAVQLLSRVSFLTPWTEACQAALPMGFSRQEDWSGLPCPSPGDLPVPGIKPVSRALQEDSSSQSHLGSPGLNLGYKKCCIR